MMTMVSRRLRAVNKRGLVMVTAALLLGTLSACGTVSAVGSSSSSGGTSGAQAGQATATPTAPATSMAAVLGSPGQAFITKYGPPTSQGDQTQGDLHFREYPGVGTDYLIVDEAKYFGVTPGDTAAYSIEVAAAPGQPWNVATAKQTCAAFAPADAQHVKQVATTSGGSAEGWDDVYMSATLAQTFPASAFQDANQGTAPAGSFDISYLYVSANDTAHVGSCQLLVGEQQTNG